MSTFHRKVRPGSHLVIDDRTGFTVWSDKTVKEELTGYRVERGRNDPRHPQEFLRTRADKQAVKNPRPPGTSNYVGPLITTTISAASPGDQSIEVETTARYLVSDRIRIQLFNGDYFPATVLDVSGTLINIIEFLPESVASGAIVENISASSTVSFS